MIKLLWAMTREEKGAALLYTIIILVLLSVIALSFISLAATERIIAVNERQSTQAFYLAESGIENALELLNEDPEAEDFEFQVNGNEINVELSRDEPGKILIVSQAEISGITRAVVVTLEKSPLSNALYSFGVEGEQSEIGNNVEITGELIVNHDLHLPQNLDFDGTISHYGEVFNKESHDDTRFIEMEEPARTGEDVIKDMFESFNEEEADTIEDDHEITENLENETIIVQGDLDVDNNIELKNVNIKVKGNFETKNNIEFENVKILAEGDMDIGNNIETSNSLFVAKGDIEIGDMNGSAVIMTKGKLDIKTEIDISGSILARNFDLATNSTLIQDLDIIKELEGIDLFRITKWSEN